MSYKIIQKPPYAEDGVLAFTVIRENTDTEETINWSTKLFKQVDVNNRAATVYDFDKAVLPEGTLHFGEGQSETEFTIIPFDDDKLEFHSEIFKIFLEGVDKLFTGTIVDDETEKFTTGQLEVNSPIFVHSLISRSKYNDKFPYKIHLEEGQTYDITLQRLPNQAYFNTVFSLTTPYYDVVDNYVATGDLLRYTAEETGVYTLELRRDYNHGANVLSVLSESDAFNQQLAGEYLAPYGVSGEEANLFLQELWDNPAHVYESMLDFGLSASILAGIVNKTNYDIHKYFYNAGISYEEIIEPKPLVLAESPCSDNSQNQEMRIEDPDSVIQKEEEINHLIALNALSPYGITINDAMNYIESNLENPQHIVDVCAEFDLDTTVLSGIVGVKTALVHEFFEGAGVYYDAIC